eukprot:scaffold48007_cov48-Cyclotella_meneghiniana.AAC.1
MVVVGGADERYFPPTLIHHTTTHHHHRVMLRIFRNGIKHITAASPSVHKLNLPIIATECGIRAAPQVPAAALDLERIDLPGFTVY